MTADIPTTEPVTLRAGNTWKWCREDLSDYPASAGWSLVYYFRNAAANFDVTATSNGDAYAVTIAKAETARRPVGEYDWSAVVISSTERHEVGTGRLEVLPDFAAAKPRDGRSFARQMLEAIEASLLDRANTDQLDLINAALEARSLARDKGGLIAMRAMFRAEVRQEDAIRAGRGPFARLRMVA